MEVDKEEMCQLLEICQSYSLHKGPICFKTTKGTAMDFML